MPKKKFETIWTSGRRKTAAAGIKLEPGQGEISVNGRPPEEYFPGELNLEHFYLPFKAVGRNPTGFSTSIKVRGGGKSAQLDAVVLGLSKALVKLDEERNRSILKKKGLLTRDPRMKERKKYGLRRARKAPQYSKR